MFQNMIALIGFRVSLLNPYKKLVDYRIIEINYVLKNNLPKISDWQVLNVATKTNTNETNN